MSSDYNHEKWHYYHFNNNEKLSILINLINWVSKWVQLDQPINKFKLIFSTKMIQLFQPTSRLLYQNFILWIHTFIWCALSIFIFIFFYFVLICMMCVSVTSYVRLCLSTQRATRFSFSLVRPVKCQTRCHKDATCLLRACLSEQSQRDKKAHITCYQLEYCYMGGTCVFSKTHALVCIFQ